MQWPPRWISVVAMVWHTAACPRNCYSTCALRVEVEGGRIRAVEPDPANRATGAGVCIKGLSYVERCASPERILRPHLKRNGHFEPVSWEEALDLLVARLQQYRAEPRSVFHYAGSGTKGLLNGLASHFWRLYGGCTTTYGDLCWPAGLEATRLTLGENLHNAPWDLVNAKLVVLWGKNPAETNIHQMGFLAQAREAGAKLVVIDPRRTESTEQADLFLQPRPGSDGALALGVAAWLVREGLVDHAFLEAHVKGYEAFAASLEPWSLARTATLTGLGTDRIEALAHLVGTVAPMTLVAGYGLQRASNGGQTLRAMLSLPVLRGQIGRPGAGWSYANLQTSIFGARSPLADYPPEPGGPTRVSVATARLGRDMVAQQDPTLRMAWVERGNPLPQNPATPETLAAFRALDFRVVIEEFMTDTAREADLVLPAKHLFEETDVIGAYWHGYLQLKKALLPLPPDVKPESWLYRELAERLGFLEAWRAEGLPEASHASTQAWLERRLAPHGLSLEALSQGPVLAPGHQEVAFADLRFPTPSGRIELWSEEARSRWGADPLPTFQERREGLAAVGPYPLQMLTPCTKHRIHSQFGNLPSMRRMDPEPRLTLPVAAARARGIAEGQWVRVFNDRGELRVRATLDGSLRPDCVSLPNGWWLQDGGAVNLLSPALETDMGHGAAFHDNLVEVAPC